MRPRVLFVEDEPSIYEPFSKALAREGFEPVVARTAARALELADGDFAIVLLDLTLPDGDGRDICRALRRSSSVPILMLTARGTEADRIVGLELGADDYVVKRERLIDEVWDTNWFGSTKTLDVHVSGLRKKLGDDSSEPRYLHTVRGVGFRFASPEEAGREAS